MAESSQSPSPLDPYLADFLALVEASEKGFLPGPESSTFASRMDIQRAFVDTLFTSARTRGLIKPMYGRGRKIRWKISPLGQAFMGSRSS